MKIRIKFKKYGLMKFIGHLDFMRAWQKFFRQSGIPIAYSEGFNPHQVFSIAAPLAVGTTGDGEYLDLKLSVESYDMDQFKKQISAALPEGVELVDALVLPEKAKAGMAACYAADYVLTLSDELKAKINDAEKIEAFLSQSTIVVKKKNKKGKINDFDLAPGIFAYEVSGKSIRCRLATGSSLNIKPELLMDALFDYMDLRLEQFTDTLFYSIHRLDIYQSTEPLRTLIEFEQNEE